MPLSQSQSGSITFTDDDNDDEDDVDATFNAIFVETWMEVGEFTNYTSENIASFLAEVVLIVWIVVSERGKVGD